jgi:hypothetical protein
MSWWKALVPSSGLLNLIQVDLFYECFKAQANNETEQHLA